MIDARTLGELLELDPANVQAKIRTGKITSRYETGEGEDAGRFRPTFFFDDQRVRPTFAEDGEVISTTRLKQGMP